MNDNIYIENLEYIVANSPKVRYWTKSNIKVLEALSDIGYKWIDGENIHGTRGHFTIMFYKNKEIDACMRYTEDSVPFVQIGIVLTKEEETIKLPKEQDRFDILGQELE